MRGERLWYNPSGLAPRERDMTLTIDLKPELEARLRAEAARHGVDAQAFVLRALEERLGHAGGAATALSAKEAELLAQVSLGMPADVWRRYHALVGKRDDAILTPAEHAELIELSDRIEEANARRVGPLVELARLRGVTLAELMAHLGITPATPA